MVNQNSIIEARQAATLLREHMETIRINLGILEVLRLNGRINESDKLYLKIIELNHRNQISYNEFLLAELPGYIETQTDPGRNALKKSFMDWAADLNLSLNFLDRIVKDYLSGMVEADQSSKSKEYSREIKDKRFWGFLDREKETDELFESFREFQESNELNQLTDPEPDVEKE